MSRKLHNDCRPLTLLTLQVTEKKIPYWSNCPIVQHRFKRVSYVAGELAQRMLWNWRSRKRNTKEEDYRYCLVVDLLSRCARLLFLWASFSWKSLSDISGVYLVCWLLVNRRKPSIVRRNMRWQLSRLWSNGTSVLYFLQTRMKAGKFILFSIILYANILKTSFSSLKRHMMLLLGTTSSRCSHSSNKLQLVWHLVVCSSNSQLYEYAESVLLIELTFVI